MVESWKRFLENWKRFQFSWKRSHFSVSSRFQFLETNPLFQETILLFLETNSLFLETNPLFLETIPVKSGNNSIKFDGKVETFPSNIWWKRFQFSKKRFLGVAYICILTIMPVVKVPSQIWQKLFCRSYGPEYFRLHNQNCGWNLLLDPLLGFLPNTLRIHLSLRLQTAECAKNW